MKFKKIYFNIKNIITLSIIITILAINSTVFADEASGLNKNNNGTIKPNAPVLKPLKPEQPQFPKVNPPSIPIPTTTQLAPISFNPKTKDNANWIDTMNKTGYKVYLDTTSQYYYDKMQIYTIKYIKNGKPIYTQIALKGKKVATLSVDTEYKENYEIPVNTEFKKIKPEYAIYNSAKMVLSNKNKKKCPETKCIKEPDFEPYIRELQKKIKMNWNPPNGNQNKQVILLFKIAKDGSLLSYSVYKSSGSPNADKAALDAVELTAPFRPLPADYKGQSIDIQFTFDYNILW